MWGTGLGPLPQGQSDTQPPAGGNLPVSVSATVGGLAVQPLYSGRAPGLAGIDQINFTVPQNAPLGCYVPVQLVANGMASNTDHHGHRRDRKPCSDINPVSSLPKTGGTTARWWCRV